MKPLPRRKVAAESKDGASIPTGRPAWRNIANRAVITPGSTDEDGDIGAGRGNDEEVQLVESARSGDEVACALLFRRHAPRLLVVLRASFDLSPEETDDVIQDTFINAFANLSRLKDPRRFGAWVLVIGRREGLLHAAAISRRAAHDTKYWQEISALVESPAVSEVDRAVAVVRDLVQALPEGPEKDTVTRFYFEGECSTDELAKELGVAKGTVTSRLARFRARLKRRLAAILNRSESTSGEAG